MSWSVGPTAGSSLKPDIHTQAISESKQGWQEVPIPSTVQPRMLYPPSKRLTGSTHHSKLVHLQLTTLTQPTRTLCCPV